MSIDKPSIAIVGAGAVGGYYGGRLAQHGHDVHFLLRSEYETWRTQGLRVQSIDGDFEISPSKIHVYNAPSAMPKVDLVIVTLKTTENHHLQSLVPPLLHESTTILTLQNGLGNEQLLAQLFGTKRIVGGLAFTCINRIAPGHIHHYDHGHVHLGEYDQPGKSPRSQSIAAMMSASKIKASVVEDMRLARWDKLVWNIPFNGLGALLDATTDHLLAADEGINLVRAIMQEVVEAARADGVAIPPDSPEKKIALTRNIRPYQTSTQIDRRQGKPMEIDAIFTRPLQIAQSAGLKVPLLQLLNFSLQQLDARRSQSVR